MKKEMTLKLLIKEAEIFCKEETEFQHRDLYGITDGKAVGTYIAHLFSKQIEQHLLLDFESIKVELNTEILFLPVEQLFSFHPYKNAEQKIYGLGYNLLIFAYENIDGHNNKTCKLNFVGCTFVAKERTGDYAMTYRLREMLKDGASEYDIAAYLNDMYMAIDDITMTKLTEMIIENPPSQGYFAISTALQWRLHYSRVFKTVEPIDGIQNII